MSQGSANNGRGGMLKMRGEVCGASAAQSAPGIPFKGNGRFAQQELPDAVYNKLIVAGKVVSPVPEPRIAGVPVPGRAADNVVTQLRVMVNGRSDKEKPVPITFDVWGKLARDCHRFLKEGSRVLVDARLRQHEWEDAGGKHARIVFLANSVQFFGLADVPCGGNTEGSPLSEQAVRVRPPAPALTKSPEAVTQRPVWHARSRPDSSRPDKETPRKSRGLHKAATKPASMSVVLGQTGKRITDNGGH